MKLIINIPETDYNTYKHFGDKGSYTERIIANGVPYKQDERPKGKWITHSDYPDRLICSNCNYKYDVWFVNNGTNYCPHCGARMER